MKKQASEKEDRGVSPYTEDSLFNGRLKCRQPRHGYRFSIDAILLANFISVQPDDRILDLGAGCGVISLILAYRWPDVRITAIELQPSLADLCAGNFTANGFQDRISVENIDLRRLPDRVRAGSFGWVVANPPYRKIATGRINPQSGQAVARHELEVNLEDVVRAAAFAVKNKGRVAMIYPVDRGAALIYEFKKQGLEPKRMQTVYSYPGDDGRLLLVEAARGGGEGLKIMPPFYVYEESGGSWSPEMARYYEG